MARLTFPLPHFFMPQSSLGQVVSAEAAMDWTVSNSCPHFWQTYSYVGMGDIYKQGLQASRGGNHIAPLLNGLLPRIDNSILGQQNKIVCDFKTTRQALPHLRAVEMDDNDAPKCVL